MRLSCNFVSVYTCTLHVYTRASLMHLSNPNTDSSKRISSNLLEYESRSRNELHNCNATAERQLAVDNIAYKRLTLLAEIYRPTTAHIRRLTKLSKVIWEQAYVADTHQ